MMSVAGLTFSIRATKPATAFTPIAVAILAALANSVVIDWQKRPTDVVWYVDLPLVTLMVLATVDCLERLTSLPPTMARSARLATLTIGTLVLASAFLGPFTLGIFRWASIVVGIPCAVMAWLTVRELFRLLRAHHS
ncbi:hypothetical protein [Pimelobacter simplex]|uniref:hypothetical protein n=1 Tax=Nocardioides simplex TaxID=2045 RepID=UPI0019341B68|nr:hypothetical protein [Pimelobacter simplex]